MKCYAIGEAGKIPSPHTGITEFSVGNPVASNMVKAGFRELGKSMKYGSLLAGVATASLAVIGTSPAWASGPVGDYPPNAEPGKCYEKVLIPQ